LILSSACHAQDSDNAKASNDIAELKALVLQMQQQIGELQKTHQKKIDALKAESADLRKSQPGEAAELKEDEAATLCRLAEDMVSEPETPQQAPEETVFKARGLSLQQLNPEFSASGDFLASYSDQHREREHGRIAMRGLELNIQGYLDAPITEGLHLDPFSRMKGTMHISEEGIDLEEASFTRFSIFPNVNLDVGKFRQQFGLLNRWHEDALDQVEYPLALRRIFGDEGLAQTGASLEWTMPPLGKMCQSLTFQVTDSENEHLFGGDTWGNPTLLLHYKNFQELSSASFS